MCDHREQIPTKPNNIKRHSRYLGWRFYLYEKAKDQKIRPYVIFNNVTLVDLATRQPMTREELLSISGIGEKKVELYGDEIAQLIKDYNTLN